MSNIRIHGGSMKRMVLLGSALVLSSGLALIGLIEKKPLGVACFVAGSYFLARGFLTMKSTGADN